MSDIPPFQRGTRQPAESYVLVAREVELRDIAFLPVCGGTRNFFVRNCLTRQFRRTRPALKPPPRPRLPGIASSLHTEVGIPTSLSHRGRNYDFAFLPKNQSAPEVRQRGCPRSIADRVFFHHSHAAVNPGVGTGLPHSILAWAQDCHTQSWRGNRNAPVHHEQLGLGTVLPRAQACDGVGPAVELPGLGHVVDADDEGQAAREECTVTLHGGCWRRRTLLSASGRCCAKEPHFPEKLLRSRTYAQAARRPARPLSAPGRRRPE